MKDADPGPAEDEPAPKRRPRHRSTIPDNPAQRRADAQLILAMVHATVAWEEASQRSASTKALRELIWSVWEQPRLPRPVYRGKYPLSVLWTPAARMAYEVPGSPVSIEHVEPSAVLVRRLLDKPPADTAVLVRILNGIEYVIIAPEDNRRLIDARVGSKLPPGSTDPWDRYRVAGLDCETFGPIAPASGITNSNSDA